MSTKQIVDRFAELGHEVDADYIDTRLNVLITQFKVPQKDAERSIIMGLCREKDVKKADYYEGSGTSDSANIADICAEEDRWYNLRVKFVDEWDTSSEFIDQTGLIGDETGVIKFTMWKNAHLSPMVVGKSYSIDNVVTNIYNDKVSVSMNKTSKLTQIDEDVAVADRNTEYIGVMVAVKKNSGLIKRCPECNRALAAGICTEHGNVDGTYDIRLMATLDDGRTTQDVIFGLEATEQIWGHSLDEAMSMAKESFDACVVMEDMIFSLVGRYFKIKGSLMEDTIFVTESEAI